MAFLTKTTTVVNDKDKLNCTFLEFSKWEFVKFNKIKKQNDVYNLDNFVILDIWYNIKWKIWNDSMNKYTAAYFSNEIKNYSEPLYLVKSIFHEKKASFSLIAKWFWENLKLNMPTEANLNIVIYIYDLNNNRLLSFSLSWMNFYNMTNKIKKYNKELWGEFWEDFWKCKFRLVNKTFFTKWDKDEKWKEILLTEKELDNLSKLELVDIKKRYKTELEYLWEKISDKEIEDLWLIEIAEDIDRYYKSRKAYYIKTYWIVEKEEDKYAKLEQEQWTKQIKEKELKWVGEFQEVTQKELQWAKEIQDIKKDRKHTNIKQEEEISIENIPF